MRALLLLLGLCGVAWAQAPEAGWWISRESLPVDGPNGEDVAIADMDGDGQAELLVLEPRGTVEIHFNVRGGLPAPIRLDAVPGARVLAALDIDLDGDRDVLLAGNRRVVALLQPADGPWISQVLFEGDGTVGARRLTVADVSGDGHPDLSVNDDLRHVVVAAEIPRIARLADRPLNQWPARFADLEGDGDTDAVAMHDGVVWLLRNDGQLPFTAIRLPHATQGRSLGFGQLDGRTPGAELVTSLDGGLVVAPNLTAAGGLFGAWAPAGVKSVYEPLFIDADGDGDQDIMGAAGDLESVMVFLENVDGQGTLTETLETGLGGRPDVGSDPVAVGDLDGDGLADQARAWFSSTILTYALRHAAISVLPRRYHRDPIRGGATIVFELDVQTLRPGVARLTGVELVAGTLGEGAPASALFSALEIYLETTGDGGWSEADTRVGALPGAALEPISRVPLADLAALDVGELRLYAVGRVAPRAHTAADHLRFGSHGGTAAAGGNAVPVGAPLPLLARWPLQNEAPTAVPDALPVDEGAQTALDVLANDQDPDGDPLQVEVVRAPDWGELTLEDGALRYAHDGREAPRTDSFTYRVTDGRDVSEPVLVELTIRPTNDPPVAQPDAYVTAEDTPLDVARDLGLLTNDGDVDSAELVAVLDVPPASGVLVLRPDGGFHYTPNPDFAGLDGFTYRADDGAAQSEPVPVTLTVQPRNDAPRPPALAYRTAAGAPVELDLAVGDPEGDAVRVFIDTLPDHGRLTHLRPDDGRVTYRPPPGFVGEARFVFRLSDGHTLSQTYQARIQVE